MSLHVKIRLHFCPLLHLYFPHIFYLFQTIFSCGGFPLPAGMQLVLLSPLSREGEKDGAGCERREVAPCESQSLIWGWVFVSGRIWAAAWAWCHGKSQPIPGALIFPEIIELSGPPFTVSNAVLFLEEWPIISEVMWDLGFLPILKWGGWFCCMYSLF